MEGTSAAQGSPGGTPQQPRVNFHIVDLPDGIIQFTATPKPLDRSTFGKKQCLGPRLARTPRRIVSPEKISDLSGMLAKLDVGISDKSTSDLSFTFDTNKKADSHGLILARRVLHARRKSRTSLTPERRQYFRNSKSDDASCSKPPVFAFAAPQPKRPPSTMFRSFQQTVSSPVKSTIGGPTSRPQFMFAGGEDEEHLFFIASAMTSSTPERRHFFQNATMTGSSCSKPAFMFGSSETRKPTASAAFKKWIGFSRISFVPPCLDEEGCRYQNIAAMEAYENTSPEELRVEDYLSGRKGAISLTHYGPKFEAPVGRDVVIRSGRSLPISTKHRCISAMSEYKDKSFEELRIEHYAPLLGWRDRKRCSLSWQEAQRLPISLDSEVYIFLDARKEGKVRFIGRLPGKSASDIHVGIEYDSPSGMGNGCHGNIRLFRTKDLHAEIVPLDSVLPKLFMDDKMVSQAESNKVDQLGSTTSPSSGMEGSQEGNKCSVCWTNPVEMFFNPCGHVCCCERCSRPMTDCPICRKRIKTKHRAYLS